jgi:DNA-binding HxlR family transcriptional regulator
MPQRPQRSEPTPEGSALAKVLAVDGTWACLWIPETGETTWVDLARVEHEPI